MASNVPITSSLAQRKTMGSSDETSSNLTMPYEDARKTIWPFRGLNAPIGELIEQRRIDAQDLGFAMEKANDGRVRAAARTMLAYYLDLPQTIQTTQHSGPKIIQGSRYLQDQERWSSAEMFFIFGVAFGFGIMLTVIFIQEWFKGTLTIPVLIVLALMLTFAVRQIYTQSRKAYKEYENYKRGREGEDRVAEQMQAHLDSKWTIFRNLVLPGRKDDLDFVLVGPAGIWAIEAKTYSPGTNIIRPSKKRLHLWSKQKRGAAPDRQAVANAARLKLFLQQRGIEINWINAVVTFAEYIPLDYAPTDDKVEVWHPSNLDFMLGNLRAGTSNALSNTDDVLSVLEQLHAK